MVIGFIVKGKIREERVIHPISGMANTPASISAIPTSPSASSRGSSWYREMRRTLSFVPGVPEEWHAVDVQGVIRRIINP
jgi:hypothetical protein